MTGILLIAAAILLTAYLRRRLEPAPRHDATVAMVQRAPAVCVTVVRPAELVTSDEVRP